MIRSVVSRVYSRLRRSKPCGCVYPIGWSNDRLPRVHRVNDEVTDDGEYVVEYKCNECGETFELNEGRFLERDVNE